MDPKSDDQVATLHGYPDRFEPKTKKRSSVSMCGALEFLCSAVLSNVAFALPKMMRNQHSSEDRLVALTFFV